MNPSNCPNEQPSPQLIQSAKQGVQAAFEELLAQYRPLIGSLVGQFASKYPMVDSDDLNQEATICFHRALMRYDCSQEAVSFGAYAKKCIANGMISFLRANKQASVNISSFDDEATVLYIDQSFPPDNPVQTVQEQENYEELCRRVRASLSDYENRVWWLYLSGRTAKEIAFALHKDEKSIQNAIYRIRQKLRSVFAPRQMPE